MHSVSVRNHNFDWPVAVAPIPKKSERERDIARDTYRYLSPAFLSTTLGAEIVQSAFTTFFLPFSFFFPFLRDLSFSLSSCSPSAFWKPGMFATLELPIRGKPDRVLTTCVAHNWLISVRHADDSRHKRLKVGRACQPCRMKKIKVQRVVSSVDRLVTNKY